jgi:hypothetical protein
MGGGGMKTMLWVQLLRLMFYIRLAVLGVAILGLLLGGHWIIALLIGLVGCLYVLNHEGTA